MTTLYLRGISVEVKSKLEIIAKENGYDNLSQFLRSQLKQIAEMGRPLQQENSVQLQLQEINKKLEKITFRFNKNNEIYAEDKNILINILGE